MNFLKKKFGNYSKCEIKKIEKKYLKKINKLENEISKCSDEELSSKTDLFKKRLSNGENLDDILPEAFATVREASKRILGMRHFDVQILGGVVLHQGRIAEMKTGEGKTLVATLPAYLNALSGEGVHIVTVNDYLAERDWKLMEPLYSFLKITSGVITSETSKEDKKELYKLDIVYLTNSELGFDYLRDNMVNRIEDKIQLRHNFVLIDEVDSILIDEARTPLIISSLSDKPTEMYKVVDSFVKTLKKEDIIIDEKLKTVILSETGIVKAEKIFAIDNYADIEHDLLRHHIKQALYANYQLKKDKNYIVKDGEILLVDEFTGRLAKGRRYSNGLHQAIEAKENVEIKQEAITLATITYQNFFKMYNKLSGMTGTAETEQQEFNCTYGLDVIVIPTNLPIKRIDKPDKLYMTEHAKMLGIIEDIITNYNNGRPVLVGTPSIEKSEELSKLLSYKNIPHQVLNAKKNDLEAEIVAQAGQKGAVTIATNMAGRGTDIKLGEGVEKLGGLKVIGTERADNRRIDNQLRGRSGRQGDAGESQFYTSFEDQLVVFATDHFKSLIEKGKKSDLKPITNKVLDNIIEKCQKINESHYFEIRKGITQYDNIINKQREIIYSQRDEVLMSTDLTDVIITMIKTSIEYILNKETLDDNGKKIYIEDLDKNLLIKTLESRIFPLGTLLRTEIEKMETIEELTAYLIDLAVNKLEEKKSLFKENFLQKAKDIILMNVDNKWRIHVGNLEDLKKDVKLLAYKQINPLESFTIQSYALIEEMSVNIAIDSIQCILNLKD